MSATHPADQEFDVREMDRVPVRNIKEYFPLLRLPVPFVAADAWSCKPCAYWAIQRVKGLV